MAHARILSLFVVVSALVAGCGGRAIDGSLSPDGTGGEGTTPTTTSAGDETNPTTHSPLNTKGGSSPALAGVSPESTPSDNGAQGAACAKATSRVTILANLNSEATVVADAWDPADPYANVNYASMLSIYDALGGEHTLAVTFRITDGGAYEYHAIVDGYVGAVDRQPGTEVSAGTLSFATDGALYRVTTTNSAPVQFDGVSGPQTITVDFGQSISDGGNGLSGTISVAGNTQVLDEGTDGAPCGERPSTASTCAWPLPHATTRLGVSANLDANAPVLPAPWNVALPLATSNYTIWTSVYDSRGGEHAMGLHFRKASPGTWEYHAVLGQDAAAVEVGSGLLTFDLSGNLLAVTGSTTLRVSFPGAAPDQSISLGFGQPDAGRFVTSVAGASSSVVPSQDGQSLPDSSSFDSSICH